MINLIAANDRVILTLVEKPKTQGGIILPESDHDSWAYGKIEAVGDKVVLVKNGDIVLFYKVDATPLEVDGERYATIRDAHIIGIYKNIKQEEKI